MIFIKFYFRLIKFFIMFNFLKKTLHHQNTPAVISLSVATGAPVVVSSLLYSKRYVRRERNIK
jgi:hypothetical protein